VSEWRFTVSEARRAESNGDRLACCEPNNSTRSG
jgi:hypothetical protein